MGTNELIAEVGKHVPYAEIMDDAKWCIHCADEWPCVTRRLADALEAAEARVKELEAGEWEYQCTNNINTTGLLGDPEIHAKQCAGRIERRRPAGPWLPVEREGE